MDKTLILGTANFGNKYGISGGLDKKQCFDILNAAWDMGIRWLDTARSYGDSEEIIGGHNKHWNIISKGDNSADRRISAERLGHLILTAYLLHHRETFALPPGFDGISIYTEDELAGINETKYGYVSIPLNLIHNKLINVLDGPYYNIARSIFMQGQAFKMPDIMGIPFYHLCWNFVTNHPNVDMVCFGVDSVKQLEDIMKIPNYEIDYTKIGSGEQWIKSLP